MGRSTKNFGWNNRQFDKDQSSHLQNGIKLILTDIQISYHMLFHHFTLSNDWYCTFTLPTSFTTLLFYTFISAIILAKKSTPWICILTINIFYSLNTSSSTLHRFRYIMWNSVQTLEIACQFLVCIISNINFRDFGNLMLQYLKLLS